MSGTLLLLAYITVPYTDSVNDDLTIYVQVSTWHLLGRKKLFIMS